MKCVSESPKDLFTSELGGSYNRAVIVIYATCYSLDRGLEKAEESPTQPWSLQTSVSPVKFPWREGFAMTHRKNHDLYVHCSTKTPHKCLYHSLWETGRKQAQDPPGSLHTHVSSVEWSSLKGRGPRWFTVRKTACSLSLIHISEPTRPWWGGGNIQPIQDLFPITKSRHKNMWFTSVNFYSTNGKNTSVWQWLNGRGCVT